jgi:hypothetical protein
MMFSSLKLVPIKSMGLVMINKHLWSVPQTVRSEGKGDFGSARHIPGLAFVVASVGVTTLSHGQKITITLSSCDRTGVDACAV